MHAKQIMDSEEFKKCADFHGHVCPGLSIGFKAAKRALEWLKESRAEDEEIVAIVETDGCGVDAVQVLTGCTLGKGNLICKDYGKNVLTLFSRKTGRGVRVAMRPDAFRSDETHLSLLRKVMTSEADEMEKAQFRELHHKRSLEVLAAAPDAFFAVTEVHREMPAKARVEPSEPCSRCGEPTMRTKLETVDGNRLCRGCLES